MKRSVLSLVFASIAILSAAEGAAIPTADGDTTSLSSLVFSRGEGGSADHSPLIHKRDLNIGHVLLSGAEIEPREVNGYQIYTQYSDAIELRQSFRATNSSEDDSATNENNSNRKLAAFNASHNDDGHVQTFSSKFQSINGIVQDGLKKFGDGKRYCTTKYHHTGNNARSHGIIWCQGSYAVQLWNVRPRKSAQSRDVRILCNQALQIADESLQATFDANAAVMPPEPAFFPVGQRGIINSWWSQDPTWGVSIVFRSNGCPTPDSREWVVLSQDSA
ncbi:hypothetical protein TWF696_003336 [Orbilia brochopaga]|uniref:Uncharacterized protein n=1 Tax=Orbilia brochopaga TaxID=3140254 RepID=A0AAV9TY07_9PEZI